jgi:hypothetical protein
MVTQQRDHATRTVPYSTCARGFARVFAEGREEFIDRKFIDRT